MYILFVAVLICELILTVPIVISTVFYLKEDRRDYQLFGASVAWLLFHLIHKTKPDTYNLEQEKLHKQLSEVLDSVRGQDFSELTELLSNLPKARSYQQLKDLANEARPKPKQLFIPNQLNMEED